MPGQTHKLGDQSADSGDLIPVLDFRISGQEEIVINYQDAVSTKIRFAVHADRSSEYGAPDGSARLEDGATS